VSTYGDIAPAHQSGPDERATLAVRPIVRPQVDPVGEHQSPLPTQADDALARVANDVTPGDVTPATNGDGDVETYHGRGGWYELPNGRKVHGRAAAIAALAELRL
jgi:hypothetical protein